MSQQTGGGKFFVGFESNRQNTRGTRNGRPQDSDIFASLREPGYSMHSPSGRPPRNGSPRGNRIGTPTRVSRMNGTPQSLIATASPYGNQYNDFPGGGSGGAAPPPPSMMPPQKYASTAADSPGSYLDRPGTNASRVKNLGDGSAPTWWGAGNTGADFQDHQANQPPPPPPPGSGVASSPKVDRRVVRQSPAHAHVRRKTGSAGSGGRPASPASALRQQQHPSNGSGAGAGAGANYAAELQQRMQHRGYGGGGGGGGGAPATSEVAGQWNQQQSNQDQGGYDHGAYDQGGYDHGAYDQRGSVSSSGGGGGEDASARMQRKLQMQQEQHHMQMTMLREEEDAAAAAAAAVMAATEAVTSASEARTSKSRTSNPGRSGSGGKTRTHTQAGKVVTPVRRKSVAKTSVERPPWGSSSKKSVAAVSASTAAGTRAIPSGSAAPAPSPNRRSASKSVYGGNYGPVSSAPTPPPPGTPPPQRAQPPSAYGSPSNSRQKVPDSPSRQRHSASRVDDQLDEIAAQLEAQLNARVAANTELASSTSATDILLQRLEEALRSQASIRQELDETERLIASDKVRLRKQQALCDNGTSKLDQLKAEGSRIAKAIEVQERKNGAQAKRLEGLLRDGLSGEATEAAAHAFNREASQHTIDIHYDGPAAQRSDRTQEQGERRSNFNLSVHEEEQEQHREDDNDDEEEEEADHNGGRYYNHGDASSRTTTTTTAYTGRDDRPVGGGGTAKRGLHVSPPRKKYEVMLGKDGRPLSPLSAAQARSKAGLDPEDEDPSLRPTEFTSCSSCGRNFSVDRIAKHLSICTKVSLNSSARKRDMQKSGFSKRSNSTASLKSLGGGGGGGSGKSYNSYEDDSASIDQGGYNNQKYSDQGYEFSDERDRGSGGYGSYEGAGSAATRRSFSPNSSGNYRNEGESPQQQQTPSAASKDAKVVASADASIYHDDAAGSDNWEPQGTSGSCKFCSRTFAAPDRLAKHQRVCAKAKKKPKKVFDPAKMRTQGTEAAKYQSKVKASAGRSSSVKKTNWREKSEAFRAAMRAGRDPTAPPPPSLEERDYVECDSCGRTFSQSAAERHIPRCRASKGVRNPLKKGKRGGR